MQFKWKADQKTEGGHHGLGSLSGAGQPMYWVGEGGRYEKFVDTLIKFLKGFFFYAVRWNIMIIVMMD